MPHQIYVDMKEREEKQIVKLKPVDAWPPIHFVRERGGLGINDILYL